MSQRTILGGVVIVVVVGVLGWAVLHHPSNNAQFPNGTWWLCDKGHSFQKTTKELSDFYAAHYGQRLPCPVCGSDQTIRAFKCPQCGTVYPAHSARKCPKCGAAVPEDS